MSRLLRGISIRSRNSIVFVEKNLCFSIKIKQRKINGVYSLKTDCHSVDHDKAKVVKINVQLKSIDTADNTHLGKDSGIIIKVSQPYLENMVED